MPRPWTMFFPGPVRRIWHRASGRKLWLIALGGSDAPLFSLSFSVSWNFTHVSEYARSLAIFLSLLPLLPFLVAFHRTFMPFIFFVVFFFAITRNPSHSHRILTRIVFSHSSHHRISPLHIPSFPIYIPFPSPLHAIFHRHHHRIYIPPTFHSNSFLRRFWYLFDIMFSFLSLFFCRCVFKRQYWGQSGILSFFFNLIFLLWFFLPSSSFISFTFSVIYLLYLFGVDMRLFPSSFLLFITASISSVAAVPTSLSSTTPIGAVYCKRI